MIVKLLPVMISMILAASTLGYAAEASAQSTTPCTASYPCAKICGDHPCAPGEVYVPGSSGTNTTKANATVAPTTTQMNIGANVTVTKTANGTMTKAANATVPVTHVPQVNGTILPLVNRTGSAIPMNNTATQVPPTEVTAPPPAVPSPAKQVSSGTAPADVKCQSGYQLVLNKFDSRPACVTPDVMAKLIARGWAAAAQS